MAESPVRREVGVTILDGAGWCPPIGEVAEFRIGADSLVVGFGWLQKQERRVLAEQITNISIAQGSRSGATFIGGGFGVKGALEGMAIATLLSKVLGRSKTWVTIVIDSSSGRAVSVVPDADVLAIRRFFRPLVDAAYTRSSTSDARFVDELERLSVLHQQGELTDEEWALAKSKLLG